MQLCLRRLDDIEDDIVNKYKEAIKVPINIEINNCLMISLDQTDRYTDIVDSVEALIELIRRRVAIVFIFCPKSWKDIISLFRHYFEEEMFTEVQILDCGIGFFQLNRGLIY